MVNLFPIFCASVVTAPGRTIRQCGRLHKKDNNTGEPWATRSDHWRGHPAFAVMFLAVVVAMEREKRRTKTRLPPMPNHWNNNGNVVKLQHRNTNVWWLLANPLNKPMKANPPPLPWYQGTPTIVGGKWLKKQEFDPKGDRKGRFGCLDPQVAAPQLVEWQIDGVKWRDDNKNGRSHWW